MTTAVKKPTKAELKAQADAEASTVAETAPEATTVAETAPEATTVAETAPEASTVAETAPEAPQPTAEETQKPALSHLQLRVKNTGKAVMCLVTKKVIKKDSEITITYESVGKLKLAKRNFAQMNAMNGSKRLQVEG